MTDDLKHIVLANRNNIELSHNSVDLLLKSLHNQKDIIIHVVNENEYKLCGDIIDCFEKRIKETKIEEMLGINELFLKIAKFNDILCFDFPKEISKFENKNPKFIKKIDKKEKKINLTQNKRKKIKKYC